MPRPAATAARIGLAAALLLALAAGHAIPPPIREYHYYYGPGRACGEPVAFDAAEGEGFEQSGQLPRLLFPGGALGFDSWSVPATGRHDNVEPLGSVELPGGVRLDRVRRSSANPQRTEIIYLYDTRGRWWAPFLAIRSNRFDGSAGDLALLGRLRFGEAARAMCADVPEPLRPTPERENFDASQLEPRTHSGPLTVCMAGVALDLRQGEEAQLPWTEHVSAFRVLRGGLRVRVDTLLWARGEGPPLSGSLAGHPGIAFVDGGVHHWSGFTPDRETGPLYVQLFRRLSGKAPRLASMPHITLAFDREWVRTERLNFAERLRVQRPDDRCFQASPLPPAPTSGL